MNGINITDAESTGTSPSTHIEEPPKHKQKTDPLLFDDHGKINANNDQSNGLIFNGAALSHKELAILWNKFEMHGHFRVEEDSITQDTIASSASSLSSSSQLNNNFINKGQYLNNQCDLEFNNASVGTNSLVLDIYQEKPISDNSFVQFSPHYSQHELYNQNAHFNTLNPSIPNHQSEVNGNENQCSFIDISNNRYEWDVASIRSDEYVMADNNT